MRVTCWECVCTGVCTGVCVRVCVYGYVRYQAVLLFILGVEKEERVALRSGAALERLLEEIARAHHLRGRVRGWVGVGGGGVGGVRGRGVRGREVRVWGVRGRNVLRS